MSHIQCHCGAIIHDISDYYSDKAYFIPDTQWFEYLDTLSACGVPPAQFQGNEDEIWHAMTNLTRHCVRHIHQCSGCGRLYVADASGTYHCFKPEFEQTSKCVLTGKLRVGDEVKAAIQENVAAYWNKRTNHSSRLNSYHAALERSENPEPIPETTGTIMVYSDEHPQGADCTGEINRELHELWKKNRK